MALETTVSAVRAQLSRMWNFIELYDLHQSNSKKDISCPSYQIYRILWFVSSCVERHRCSGLLVFLSKASSFLRLVPSSYEDDVEIKLEKVAHQIVRDDMNQ